MGGKALLKYGIETRRLNTDDFNRLATNISKQVSIDLGINTYVPKCYHRKETHGDLDLLLKIDHEFHNKGFNLRKYINNTFKPNAIFNNGGVYSFDYEDFQIDFIPIKESNWDNAKTYFSYDPLGNIMGKTFYRFGLSYGWDGLQYRFRGFSGRVSKDILITKDVRKIFEFGGYNYDRFLQGFDTLEEIFDFAIDSKYFNFDVFKFENLKHKDKKRNRKRGSYHQFLKYIEDNNPDNKVSFSKDKDIYLHLIDESFPNVKIMEKLEKLKENDEINKQLAEKFNGNVIMKWYPELQGKILGNAIKEFKFSLGENYKKFILENNIDIIRNHFAKIYTNL